MSLYTTLYSLSNSLVRHPPSPQKLIAQLLVCSCPPYAIVGRVIYAVGPAVIFAFASGPNPWHRSVPSFMLLPFFSLPRPW